MCQVNDRGGQRFDSQGARISLLLPERQIGALTSRSRQSEGSR